jgi:hypothetical protein
LVQKLLRVVALTILATGLLVPDSWATDRAGTRDARPAAIAGIERHGSCKVYGHWELDLSYEGGRVEVDFEVDTARAGKTWRVRVTHNGTTALTGTRVSDHEGDFDVEVHTSNASGADHYTARATQAATGAVCVGTGSI